MINLDLFGSVSYCIRSNWEDCRLDEYNLEGFGFLPGGKPMASHTYDFAHFRTLYIRQRREWLDETQQNIIRFIGTVIPDSELDDYIANRVRCEYLVESDNYRHYYYMYVLPNEDGTPIQFSNHVCATPEEVTVWEARYSYPTALESFPDPFWGGLIPRVGYNYFCNSVRYHPGKVLA